MADAVLVEPLSTPKFPANREKNREFRNIAALGAPETTINSVVIGFPMRIPYSTEQEIILPEQGLLAKEQGILSAEVEFTARGGGGGGGDFLDNGRLGSVRCYWWSQLIDATLYLRGKRWSVTMDRRFRRGFTAAEKTELWDRWQRGESLKAIGRAFGKPSSSIYNQVAPQATVPEPVGACVFNFCAPVGLFRTTNFQKSCEKSWRGVAAFRSTQSFYSPFDERYQLTTAKLFSLSSTCRCPRLSPWLSSTSSGVRAGTSGNTGRPPGSRTSGARDR